MSLREDLIRLAHAKPELRTALLPLVTAKVVQVKGPQVSKAIDKAYRSGMDEAKARWPRRTPEEEITDKEEMRRDVGPWKQDLGEHTRSLAKLTSPNGQGHWERQTGLMGNLLLTSAKLAGLIAYVESRLAFD